MHVQVRWEDPHASADAGAGLEAPEATEWAVDAIAFGAGPLGIGLATAANGVSAADGAEVHLRMIEMWFLFCLMWSLGISTDEEGRKEVDGFMRERLQYQDGSYVQHAAGVDDDANHCGWGPARRQHQRGGAAGHDRPGRRRRH